MLRTIETKMIAAIRNGQTWKSDNTMVRFENGAAIVFLHGHRIAYVYPDRTVRVSLAGWNTVTTRSRVNAILSQLVAGFNRVHTVKGVPHLTVGGRGPLNPDRTIPIGSDDWLTFNETGELVAGTHS